MVVNFLDKVGGPAPEVFTHRRGHFVVCRERTSRSVGAQRDGLVLTACSQDLRMSGDRVSGVVRGGPLSCLVRDGAPEETTSTRIAQHSAWRTQNPLLARA